MALRRLYEQALMSAPKKLTKPRIITFVNHTQNSGKHVTVMNVGYGLALLGKIVLVIDLSLHTKSKCSFGLSSYFALTMGRSSTLPFLDENIPAGSLEIIPGDARLLDIEKEIQKRIDKDLLLKNFITTLPASYDYILINCPSSLCIRTINALASTEELIIPVKAGTQRFEELNLLLKTVSLVIEQHNPDLKILGVLFIGKSEDIATFLKNAQQENLHVAIFKAKIREDHTLFENLPENKILLAEHPDSAVGIDYLEFARGIFSLGNEQRRSPPEYPDLLHH